jgi:hypothetical protein
VARSIAPAQGCGPEEMSRKQSPRIGLESLITIIVAVAVVAAAIGTGAYLWNRLQSQSVSPTRYDGLMPSDLVSVRRWHYERARRLFWPRTREYRALLHLRFRFRARIFPLRLGRRRWLRCPRDPRRGRVSTVGPLQGGKSDLRKRHPSERRGVDSRHVRAGKWVDRFRWEYAPDRSLDQRNRRSERRADLCQRRQPSVRSGSTGDGHQRIAVGLVLCSDSCLRGNRTPFRTQEEPPPTRPLCLRR